MLTHPGSQGSNSRILSVPRPQLAAAGEWLRGADGLLDRGQPLAVGYSGGADSTALLLALAAWHPQLEAWHIDHGWHGESQQQAQALAEQCRGWQIPFRCHRVDCDPHRNREASARRARMAAFATLARSQGIHQIALAHHREDQAETVLMRLLQGAGVRGCCGMRPVQSLGALRLIRPLLGQSSEALRVALRQAGVGWLEDPSNRDTTLLRNRLRHALLPAMDALLQPGDASTLFTRLAAQAERVHLQVTTLADAVGIRPVQGGVEVEWPVWCRQQAPVRAAILQSMAAELLGASFCLGRRHIQLIEVWRQQGGRRGVDLSSSRLLHEKLRLRLVKR